MALYDDVGPAGAFTGASVRREGRAVDVSPAYAGVCGTIAAETLQGRQLDELSLRTSVHDKQLGDGHGTTRSIAGSAPAAVTSSAPYRGPRPDTSAGNNVSRN